MATLPQVPAQQPDQTFTAIKANPQPAANAAQSQDPNGETTGENDQYAELLAQYGPKLIELARKIRDSWQWKRRGIVQKVLQNKEMLKGNHNIGFYPGTYDTFDAFDEYYNFSGGDPKNEDRSIDRRPHNFYQMLEKAFVSALSAQTPKTRFMPEDADREEDRQTAKAGSRIMTIIERANHIKGQMRQALMELFTSGCYFRQTRYVVDPDRTGTHKATLLQMVKGEVLPSRYICFNCGITTPEDAMAAQGDLTCPNCGQPMGPENFFESHVDTMPVAEVKGDVPNGMVLQTLYGPIHADADPDAPDLLNTPLLNISEEVSRGWLRTTFQEKWDQFAGNNSTGSSNELLERQYRSMLTTPSGHAAWMGQSANDKPTYSRTWFQPMAFGEMELREDAEALLKAFPKGCMLAWVEDLPLQLRPAKLTEEWTWCSTEQRGFGLFPPPAGDPAVPVQQRINDCIQKIDDYMDRLACGILLANEKYVDTKKMNGKIMLPGVINGVAFEEGASPASIQDAIFQVKAEIDAKIFEYVSLLKQDMELLVGTPPQTFGAGTQQGVETFGGQEQQLNTGMMKLGLHWDTIREEYADASENAIKCASQNMTEDWKNVVTDETKEARNEYVHLDEMKGSVHAEPETDQGFPMTFAEIKDFYKDLLTRGDQQLVEWFMSEPTNVDEAIRYMGVPGLTAPGAAMRSKLLRTLDQLLKSAAVPMQNPVTGEPMMMPSILPNKYLDDLGASQKLIQLWAQDHWDKLEENPQAMENVVAYFKLCVVMSKELEAEQQLAAAPPPNQAPGGAQPQPAMA